MGKSDNIVFQSYRDALNRRAKTLTFDSVLFLGQPTDNAFTAQINAKRKIFLDLSLNNWNINSGLSLNDKFDLIVCTRCAYFSKNPKEFISSVSTHLNDKGIALVDWGLGDHWRFNKYKVGWVRDDEHEFAYNPDNKLYSTMWRNSFASNDNVTLFWNAVKNKCPDVYSNKLIENVVKEEVPSLVDYDADINILALWPTEPQLYIVTTFDKLGLIKE